MLKRGDTAPDFPVGATTLHRMLESQAVLVFFFPKAFTPGCTLEAGAFQRERPALSALGCEVVGVSADRQDKNDAFACSLDLAYPMVGDPDAAILRAYGVRWPLVGLARRVSFLVGRDRTVLAVFRSEWNAEGHVTEALKAARALSR